MGLHPRAQGNPAPAAEMNESELNIEDRDSLCSYLRRTGHYSGSSEPGFTCLAGGVSSRTVLVELPDGRAWVLKQALPKLRVAVDWFSDPARVHREALGLQWLAELAPPGTVPKLVFEDQDHHVVAMEAVPQPHHNWKTLLLAGKVESDHVRQFGRLLGTIQRRSAERRDVLALVFDDRQFFESLRIEPYYSYTATQVPAAAEFLNDLIAATRSRRFTVVHGDYSPKNILIRAGRLVLLDHEVIHWGDPAFDVGFALAHFLSKAHHLPDRRGPFAQAAREFYGTYASELPSEVWAADVESFTVRHALGCLLARACGRSTLEYLDTIERQRQRDAALSLLVHPPCTVPALTEGFLERLK